MRIGCASSVLSIAFVDRHGSIKRREAADLCQIDSEQARLLRRLRADGKLELIGQRRTAHYVKLKCVEGRAKKEGLH